MKQCTKCGVVKPLTEFHKRPETKDGRRTDCKECNQKQKAERWASTPPEVRKAKNIVSRLKYQYGMTPADYVKKVEEQNNKCFICEQEAGYNDKPLYVDHCHTTGNVRKLLCQHCNSGLGMFRDNPELLSKAADYLKEHNG
jgi:hypothetical protein